MIKAIKLREILLRFSVYIFSLIIIYFTILAFLNYFVLSSKTFHIEYIDEFVSEEGTYAKNTLNLGIIEKELLIENKRMKHEEVIDNETQDDSNNNEIEKNENNYIFSSNEKIKPAKRENNYDVEIYSSGKIRVGNTTIDNYSGIDLDLNELSKPSEFTFSDNTNILIYHTHTSEAYEEAGLESNFRTTDDNYNVVSVGEVLKENLKLRNFNVYHDITKHDTPSYNGAYNNSLNTAQRLMKDTNYDVIIDLHRDALSGNLHFRPTTQINGETSSKLMFVIGTNGSGLSHDNWMNNLKLAILIQNTAEEMYPGLFRNLNLAKYRYNQHLSDGAMIIEVGATGNTLNETKTAMKYLTNVLEALRQ